MGLVSLHNLIWIGTWLILIVAPNLTPPFVDFSYDGVRLEVLTVLSLGLVGLVISPTARQGLLTLWSTFDAKARVLLLAALSLSILASLTAPHPSIAALETANFIALALWALTMGSFLREGACAPLLTSRSGATITPILSLTNPSLDATIVTGLVVSICAAFSSIHWFVPLFSHVWTTHHTPPWNLPYLPLAHPRFLNQFQIVWFGFLAYTAIWLSHHHWRFLARIVTLILGFWIAVMLSSEGRGATLAFAATLGLLWLQRDEDSRTVARSLVAGALVGLGLYAFAHYLLPLALGGPQALSPPRIAQYGLYSNGRFEFWQKAWQIIQEHPLLGGGPLHYRHYFPDLPSHPHGSLPQLGYEYGLPLTLILLALFLRAWWWLYHTPSSPTRSVFLFSMTASGLYSLVSGVIVMPLAQFSLAVVTALMLGCLYHPLATPAKASPKHHFALISLATMVMAVLGYRLYIDLPKRLDGSLLGLPPPHFSSFWQIPHF